MCLAAASVRAATVELFAPRPFGYFLGDLITLEAVVTLDPGFRLEPGSLPRPRPVTYWLDLRRAELADLPQVNGARRYRLTLTYQTFYAPLETRGLDIPAVPLTARDGDHVLNLTVPAWSFASSPLRSLIAGGGANPMALQPDIAPRPHPLRTDLRRAGGAAALSLACALGLAGLRGWGPFGRRRPPFSAAARDMRRMLAAPPAAEAYSKALLRLHRAFDAAAGRRLLADDVPDFLAAAPHLATAADTIARFFHASRVAFFGQGPDAAMAEMAPEALLSLARRLAVAERKGAVRPAAAPAAREATA
ncbi:nonribosomal peptide synthetase MxaA [Xanthobacter autotrophicus]|uniref:nonribosomal peptide synthetase MxaA n=1 Tax=Xanthobacter autotrophicus TaxID=280 RepID=UPI0024A61BDC|nr:nonribosomal peptide synthetase MxaA [Xanthobacter autotrophicus]MDI4655292.1 nonribosomal peptide synthetase MxaA [Xanthobacter autotrophicus]